jgi:hypothetical protein
MASSDIAGLDINPSDLKIPCFSPEDFIGKLFVRDLDDGNSYRAKVVCKIIDQNSENHANIKFLAELGDGEFDEIITYNKLCDILSNLEDQEENQEEPKWTFTAILGHQGPLTYSHPDYKGSNYNVLVRWEDGSQSYDPL